MYVNVYVPKSGGSVVPKSDVYKCSDPHICVCDKRHALIISFGVASSLFSTLNIATFSTLEFLHDWPRHASVILPLRQRGGPQKDRRIPSYCHWSYGWKSSREPYGRVYEV